MSVEPEETEVVICEACGATNAAHNQICVRCEAPLVGTPVEPIVQTTSPAWQQEPTAQDKGKGFLPGLWDGLWGAQMVVGAALILLLILVDSGLKVDRGMEYGWLCLLSCLIAIPVAAVAYAVWKRWG